MTPAQRKLRAAIAAAHPCHKQEVIDGWAAHWPRNVTLHWLLTHAKRGDSTVSVADRILTAQKLLPKPALARATRRIVLRAARIHAADACEAAGRRDLALTLRALTIRSTYAEIEAAARAASAASAASWAASAASSDAASAAAWAARAASAASAAAWAAACDASWTAELDAQLADYACECKPGRKR